MRSGMIIFLSILDKLLFYSYLEFENLKKVSAQVNKINQMILIDNIVWRTREGVGLWSGRPGVESRRRTSRIHDLPRAGVPRNVTFGINVGIKGLVLGKGYLMGCRVSKSGWKGGRTEYPHGWIRWGKFKISTLLDLVNPVLCRGR